MSREQVFSHAHVKTEFTIVFGGLVKAEKLGRYFTDGLRLTDLDADISVLPDGTFISWETMREGNIKLIEGARGGYVEIEGVPDLVLEILSDSSVKKDTLKLLRLYWEAGIPEYWLIDVRGDRLTFELYRHTMKRYVKTRKQDGWVKSAVLGKSFRLTRADDPFGNPEYTLAVR
jgi:Uma2 family endonuclease